MSFFNPLSLIKEMAFTLSGRRETPPIRVSGPVRSSVFGLRKFSPIGSPLRPLLENGQSLEAIAELDPITRKFIGWKITPPRGSLAEQRMNKRRGQSRGKYLQAQPTI